MIRRHNAIRDTEIKIIKEVCYDVRAEPLLTPLTEADQMRQSTNTAAHARLDISARGVWSPSDRSYFDIRVSHPNSPSYKDKTLKQIYNDNELEKKRLYNERVINVERANFTPLVFLTSGGMAPECKRFNDHMARMIAKKKNEEYADVVRCLRTKLRFAMLKSTLVSVRGYRGRTEDKKETGVGNIAYNLIPQMVAT